VNRAIHQVLEDAAAEAEVRTLTTTLASCNRARQEEGRQRDAALAEVERLRGALEGVAQSVDRTGLCWCAYERLIHPQDDPQDALPLEPNGHTGGCNAARAALAAPVEPAPVAPASEPDDGQRWRDDGQGWLASDCVHCGKPTLGFRYCLDCSNHFGG